MNREELDRLWFKAMRQTRKANEPYNRYHFAALVAAAERDRVVRIIEAQDVDPAFKHRLASVIKEPPR